MKITEALLAEHVVFHNIFDHIEHVLPKLKTLAEVKGWAGLMEGLLLAHGKTEEDLVFAPLNHYLEQLGQRDSFEHEHREIDNSLLRVKTAKRLPEARQLLLQAVTASRKHFDREERIVFPLAEQVMKERNAGRTGQGLDEAKGRGVGLKRDVIPIPDGRAALLRGHHPWRRSSAALPYVANAAFTPATSALTRVVNGKSDGASRV